MCRACGRINFEIGGARFCTRHLMSEMQSSGLSSVLRLTFVGALTVDAFSVPLAVFNDVIGLISSSATVDVTVMDTYQLSMGLSFHLYGGEIAPVTHCRGDKFSPFITIGSGPRLVHNVEITKND